MKQNKTFTHALHASTDRKKKKENDSNNIFRKCITSMYSSCAVKSEIFSMFQVCSHTVPGKLGALLRDTEILYTAR